MNPAVKRERKDMAGQRFGALTVLRIAPTSHRELHWECLCDCGASTVVRGSSLRNGHTASCGSARHRPYRPAANRTHGQSKTPTWYVWVGMRKRCSDPKAEKYAIYGGRGIRVCERWSDFANFLADMGERPAGMTIERNDVDGNYEPGNCRWATPKEQNNNRRSNRFVEVGGRRMTVSQLSDACGMSTSSIGRRLKKGAAFMTPIGEAREAQ